MIEVRVDPTAHDPLDRGKIDDHAQRVEVIRFERDKGPPIVAVQMPAFAVVGRDTVASVELQPAGN